MIYMRPWQLIYSIWYNRCIKLYHIFWSYHVYICISELNTSWIHLGTIHLLIPKNPIRFFCGSPEFASRHASILCVPWRTEKVNPDERELVRPQMAISKVAFSNAWMILWWELMMILILVFQEIIFLMSCYFLWLFPNVFWPWWRNHMSLLMSLLISFLGFHDVTWTTNPEVVVSRTRFSTSRYAWLGWRRRHETKHLIFCKLFIGCVALWCLLLSLSWWACKKVAWIATVGDPTF